MKLGIMQPYLFPYIGYFQLIHAVDKFVLFDDVNYINRGWINRNRILVNNKDYMFTMSLDKASQNKLINEINLSEDMAWRTKLLNTLKMSYSRALVFQDVYPLLEEIIMLDEKNLSRFIRSSLQMVCKYLYIQTEIIPSSTPYATLDFKGAYKILEICKKEGANEYINPIGGREIYDPALFAENNIRLHFLESNPLIYKQGAEPFVPCLSIIDILMFNPPDKISAYLNEFTLISA